EIDNDRSGIIRSSQIVLLPITVKYKYSYDDKGRKIEEEVYINDNINYNAKKIWKYDKNGNNIEIIRFDSVGESYTSNIFIYDENGRKVEEKTYDINGNLFLHIVLKYNEKGNKTEETTIVNDKVDNQEIWKY